MSVPHLFTEADDNTTQGNYDTETHLCSITH